jgi:riboflavin synthase
MFTGLIEGVGEVSDVVPAGDGVRLSVRAPELLSDAAVGDSICVSGVCLTVTDFDAEVFTADVIEQTLTVSTLDRIEPGQRVNLERAARLDTRLGGHIVQGHIDGTATVQEVRPGNQWRVLRLSVDRKLAPFIANKGSITLDGVSLTVSRVSDAAAVEQWFEVSLIPETLEATTLGGLEAQDQVNLETDIVARHIARIQDFQAHSAAPKKGTEQ